MNSLSDASYMLAEELDGDATQIVDRIKAYLNRFNREQLEELKNVK